MFSMPKILCIIPARGGSKGVPRKNIQLVGNRPLVSWAIHAALESGVIGKLVVSTDDAEIKQVSLDAGAEVIDRPEVLSGDGASTESAMVHALQIVESSGFAPDFISLIQCTSPFLSTTIIRECVAKVTDGGFDSCITVFKPDGYEFKWRSTDGEVFVPDHDVEHRPRRQDLDLPYHENGAFYITRTDLFTRANNRFGGNLARVGGVCMTELDSLQIDSPEHLLIADMLMRIRENGA